MDGCHAFVGCSAFELYGSTNARYHEAVYDDNFLRAGKCRKLWQADGNFPLDIRLDEPGFRFNSRQNKQEMVNYRQFVYMVCRHYADGIRH